MKDDEDIKNIPVIIFTIYDEPETKRYARTNNIPFLIKQKTVPDQLLQEVRNSGMLGG